jgi:hypothetical protein
MNRRQEAFFTVGKRVQRRTYSVRYVWQPWMGEDRTMPVAVLASMADHEQCDSEEAARDRAVSLNADARLTGNYLSLRVVVP